MNRKEFLRNSSAVMIPALLNGFTIKAFGHGQMLSNVLGPLVDTDHVLVIVQLFGGNDGLNTVIPVSNYRNYFNARKNIAIAENKILPLTGIKDVGLHPSLSGFRDLYNEGKLAILHSVGYKSPNFSHFRSSDIWMSGSDADQIINTGWAGRYLNQQYPAYPAGFPNAAMEAPLAIQIGTATSFIFQGNKAPMAVNIGDPQHIFGVSNGFSNPVPDTKGGERLSFIREIAQRSQSYSRVIKTAADNVSKQADYPDNNILANQLKTVARLIKGGLKTKIYLVGFDGFDTHAQQVTASDTSAGRHADLLKITGDAINAFQRDLEFLNINKQVVGMTFSEFGRRIASNDSLGTDHGSAAPLFVFGSAIKGGITGTSPDIPEKVTNDDNIAMQTDYRSVYFSLLRNWMNVPETELVKTLYKDYNGLQLIN